MPPKQDDNHIPLSPRSVQGSSGDHVSPTRLKVNSGYQVVSGGQNWGDYCFGDVDAHFENSSLRAQKLACRLDQTAETPTVSACKSTVESKLPSILEQTSHLIENWKKSRSDSERMVAKIRTTLILQSMDQCLDKIELTLSELPEKQALEDGLSDVIESLRQQGYGRDSQQLSCSISPLHSSSLYFDLAVGAPATMRCDSLPLEVEVQPVMELLASDLTNGRVSADRIQAYRVQVESCKHREEPFHQGSGSAGLATLRVRLSKPTLEPQKAAASDEWTSALEASGRCEYKSIRVKEVRVTQVNAYPPKPRSNVDIYTSTVFGEPDISATLIATTYQTKYGEPPKLHIELVMPTVLRNSSD